MASIFSRISALLGGGSAAAPAAGARHEQEIDGFKVVATPMKEGGQYRICGQIETEIEGQILTRQFIRADVFSNEDEAVAATFRKATQIVGQMRNSIFADGAPEGRV
jgi:hypothetical protein